jgi:ComF family protein
VRELLNPVVELIYPTYCGGCGSQGDLLCPACTDAFVPIDESSACPVCGRPVGRVIVCGACITRRTYFQRGYFGFSFEGPLREALHAFKFRGRKDVGRALVQSLKERIGAIGNTFDVIVPLPVTEKRLKARGFNQSFIISEEISRMTGKPIDYSTLLKIRETQDQHTLSKEERKKNVARAFGLKETAGRSRRPWGLEGKRILLVDDLFTTGSTASEAAKTLGRARPERILFFALARTPE